MIDDGIVKLVRYWVIVYLELFRDEHFMTHLEFQNEHLFLKFYFGERSHDVIHTLEYFEFLEQDQLAIMVTFELFLVLVIDYFGLRHLN